MRTKDSRLSKDDISSLCAKAFGEKTTLSSIKEIAGGTFNETYLIKFKNQKRVILRVAPPISENQNWDDQNLMRREQTILPHFSKISHLVPEIILSDFSHQMIDRDFMFQTFLEGERWSEIEDLCSEQELELWRQCGKITRSIHQTQGDHFGFPFPGMRFAKWSQTVIHCFEKINQSLIFHEINNNDFLNILELLKTNASLLDKDQTPQLLHGDLWTFNLLVDRSQKNVIVGVIDVDRAWWGDPRADWIIFLLSIRKPKPDWQEKIEAFYAGYGKQDLSDNADFLENVYQAMHFGSAAIWSSINDNYDDVRRANIELEMIAHSIFIDKGDS
jgi:aminoglycoside phosphotransferase (APT) family kinase protein